jgi:phosphatidylglycerol:prolipoprotein diacylglycerol transferase
MYPLLFSIGPLTISSFGLFLALGFLMGLFAVWRIGNVYDISGTKIVDLAILTFLIGFIFSRLVFVIFNWQMFGDFYKVVSINHYPGLSFWGGLVGGAISLWILAARAKLQVWQIIDFASVGLILGMVLGDIGCFLGGCSFGVLSSLPFATPVVGLLGRRFPIAAVEALALFLASFYLWDQVIKFHFNGKISAISLMVLGMIKFLTEFGRGDTKPLFTGSFLTFGHFFSLVIFILGLIIFYLRSKRSLKKDLMTLLTKKGWQVILLSIRKSWYNTAIYWKAKSNKKFMALARLVSRIKRRLNVKSTPTNTF